MRRIISLFFCALLCAGALSAQEKMDTLKTARVTADANKRTSNSTQTGLEQLDSRKLNRGFALFNSPDVIKTLQALPGVASGTELLSGLYVRGGDGSDNLFLLDGVPIYQVSHFGGIFSSFNSDVIDELDFYKGGFPARYGGRMSSVVDVRTREGDFEKFHGTWSIGLIDGRAQLEGPIVKGKTSFNVGLRRTWLDVVTRPALAYANAKSRRESRNGDADKYTVSYDFSDFNAGITHRINPCNTLRLNFFSGLDNLPISVEMPYTQTTSGPGGDTQHRGEDTVKGRLLWGNVLTSLGWKTELTPKLSGNVLAYYSRNLSDLGVDLVEWSWDDGDNYFKYGESVRSYVHDAGAKADFDFLASVSHHLRFGASAAYHIYEPTRNYYLTIEQPGYKHTDKDSRGVKHSGTEGALYAEDEMSLAPWLKGNVGLRAAMFDGGGKIWPVLEPRAALKVQPWENTSLKLSYAEMNQFTHQIATSYIDLPTNTWMPSTATIKPMRSRQASAGVYSSLRNGISLSLEGWYKTMDHLYEYAGTNMLYPPLDQWESEFTEGRGRSWGAEASIEYESEKVLASAYYTLSWNQRRFDELYFTWYPDRNDNRHKLTLQCNYKFGKKFDAYVGWNYHSGSWITAPLYHGRYEGESSYYFELYGRPNGLQLPDYHRLDLGLNFRHKTRRGNEGIWNLSVYNAYCRMNAVFALVDDEYEKDEWGNDTKPTGRKIGTAIGIVPIIPTFGYTLKF